MTDIDIASHYGLPSEFPEEWPAELDEEDPSDTESLPAGDGSRSQKSRYFALERSGSQRTTLGSQRGGGGRDNLAQKDEPDPLGSGDSVLKILKKRGLSVDDESRLRNRFLLSSTSFSPALFLSQAHSNDSIQALLDGLGCLSKSIDQKSASLKVLVQFMAMASRWKRDALRLVHLPTCTVYRNWPTSNTPLGRISAVAVSPNSEQLAVANEQGRIRMWEIRG